MEFLVRGILAVFFLLVSASVYFSGVQQGNRDSDRVTEPAFSLVFSRPLLTNKLEQSLQAGSATEIHNIARQLAVLTPVDELPYEAALAIAISNGEEEAADIFAVHALKRQPRSLAARLYLWQRAVERNDFHAAVEQYDRLSELRSLNDRLLSRAVVGVFRDSDDWSVLLTYLEKQPRTGPAIVKRLLGETTLPADLQRVMQLYPTAQELYFKQIIKQRGFSQAFEAWRELNDFPYDDDMVLPFNNTFEIRAEAPPFNWSVEYERAELQDRGGLYVSFAGTGNPLIVRQVFAALPGHYILRSTASGRMPQNGGAIVWNIYCSANGASLAQLPISFDKVSELEVFETSMVIPPDGCQFQTLDLRGRAGTFPKTSRTEIKSVSLVRLPSEEK